MSRIPKLAVLMLVLSSCGIPTFGEEVRPIGLPDDPAVKALLPELPDGYEYVTFDGRLLNDEGVSLIEVTFAPLGKAPEQLMRLCVKSAGQAEAVCPQGENGDSFALSGMATRFDATEPSEVLLFCADPRCTQDLLTEFGAAWE